VYNPAKSAQVGDSSLGTSSLLGSLLCSLLGHGLCVPLLTLRHGQAVPARRQRKIGGREAAARQTCTAFARALCGVCGECASRGIPAATAPQAASQPQPADTSGPSAEPSPSARRRRQGGAVLRQREPCPRSFFPPPSYVLVVLRLLRGIFQVLGTRFVALVAARASAPHSSWRASGFHAAGVTWGDIMMRGGRRHGRRALFKGVQGQQSGGNK